MNCRSEGDGEHQIMKDQEVPQKISYANIIKPASLRKPDVLVHRCVIIQPVVNNGVISIKIPESMYQDRIKQFQHALIGRVLLRKGEKPRLVSDLKKELQVLWQPKSDWKLIPMSKGFYTLKFTTAEDKFNAKCKSSWSLASGTLRLRDWVRNFDPYKEISSICQVWMRIYYLPVEYWTKEIISSIGNSVGVPIKVDGVTADGDVGHFARVLVEVDLALPLPDSVHVDCPDQYFYVELGYEQLPHFCTKCKITGHTLDKCNKRSIGKVIEQPDNSKDGNVVDAATEKRNTKGDEDFQFGRPRSTWQPKPAKEKAMASDNRFSVLDAQNLSGPDLLEAITKPVSEKDLQEMGHESIPAESVSEEEDVEHTEMEQDPNVSCLMAEQQNNLTDAAEETKREMESPVETQRVETAAATEKAETDLILSETSVQNLLEKEIKVQRVVNLVQNKSTEGLSKDKEPLQTAKKKGRQPGQTRVDRKLVLTTDNIKDLLRRPPDMRAEPNTESMELIKDQLYKAWEAGGTPRDFVITNDGSPSARTMTKVAAKTWAEEVEREESLATKN
ncbi:uncharacterized protein LOC130990900 [Salvia miltiorrhiza]|uniref:uncharacterized protein LOC130990900 n=1 Tax=Salvia miltiorrhiza TaxID=226208 RepID=UPI0025AD1498|nr:uncharacterized protein LOC130990900 [Salvia miltiorrhiza]